MAAKKTLFALLLIASFVALASSAAGHVPSRLAGTPFALDNSGSPFSHTGVCWYGQIQPGYWECYGTWNHNGVNCAYGHWYWDLSGNYFHWCYA